MGEHRWVVERGGQRSLIIIYFNTKLLVRNKSRKIECAKKRLKMYSPGRVPYDLTAFSENHGVRHFEKKKIG